MTKRKRYGPEYKRELVELVRQSQSSCRQIALEVGATRTCRPGGCVTQSPEATIPFPVIGRRAGLCVRRRFHDGLQGIAGARRPRERKVTQ